VILASQYAQAFMRVWKWLSIHWMSWPQLAVPYSIIILVENIIAGLHVATFYPVFLHIHVVQVAVSCTSLFRMNAVLISTWEITPRFRV
jgi:hypothetical protein